MPNLQVLKEEIEALIDVEVEREIEETEKLSGHKLNSAEKLLVKTSFIAGMKFGMRFNRRKDVD